MHRLGRRSPGCWRPDDERGALRRAHVGQQAEWRGWRANWDNCCVVGNSIGRQDDSLLLVTCVEIRETARGPLIDDQTAAGIAQWCKHFERVTFIGVEAPPPSAGGSSVTWVDIRESVGCGGATLLSLPRAYRPVSMLKGYPRSRALLRRQIEQHRHLCFTIGGMLGDWPAVGAFEAIRMGRRYAAWTDRAEPLVIRQKLESASVPMRVAGKVAVPVIEAMGRRIFNKSAVALLQGRDTFGFFEDSAKDPHCTYDTHTTVSDQITSDRLAQKMSRVRSGAPLRIVYAGRAAAMKGPQDWLEVLMNLRALEVPFHATWIGDGPELLGMQDRAEQLGITDVVTFAGFENRRDVLLDRMQDSDLLLFCHKTPESARCLIEALVSGTPTVGYESAYPRGLAEAHGGGLFTPQGDIHQLVDRIADLHNDRDLLANLIEAAAQSGSLYNEDAVYAHRANLMHRG